MSALLQKLAILAFFMSPNLVYANQSLFHIDYKKIEDISMSITPNGEVVNYSEGKSTSVNTQKIKVKK